LEENLSLAELTAIVTAARDLERSRQKFAAALKGIDLDGAEEESAKEKFEAAKRRAEAVLNGMDEREADFLHTGLGFETE
jgi:hypothetical protein